MKLKRIAAIVLAALFLYLSLYTWNLRTGHLDQFSSYIGLDVAGWVLGPGIWAKDKAVGFWDRYVYLVGVREENDLLRQQNHALILDNNLLRRQANTVTRLQRLLRFTPPARWQAEGARVVAHRLGPSAVLETIVLDRGRLAGVAEDNPVMAVDGVMGRVISVGATACSVLLLSDANSRVAVIGQDNRAVGILAGHGTGQPLTVEYVNLNARVDPGELLVTSGLSGQFPKGLPVARVTNVERFDISLFLSVQAEPLIDPWSQEEVLVLRPVPESMPTTAPSAGADAVQGEGG